MRIGIIIGRIGGEDGVALETEKWIYVLRNLGHEVFVISGEFEHKILDKKHRELCKGMGFYSRKNKIEQKRAFLDPSKSLGSLLKDIDKRSDKISKKIINWIDNNKLDVVISENASALPLNLSLAVAIKKVSKTKKTRIVCHDHDYYWERGERYVSKHKEINKMVRDTFPLRGKNVSHVVINSYAADTLHSRYGIKHAQVVPNVMNFDKPFGRKTKYNDDLIKKLKLKKRDIPIFQITRIVKRKGIETALELIEKLQDDRFKLVIVGRRKDDAEYYKFLRSRIRKLGLKRQVIFADNLVFHCGSFVNGGNSCDNGKRRGRKIYSLSDVYAHARGVSYFSTYEGFGNAFVEAVLAKKPVFVNNYKPVFWPDIGSRGFEVVMLEDNNLTDEKVKEIKKILLDRKLTKKIAEKNFKIGRKYFSYQVLEKELRKILRK